MVANQQSYEHGLEDLKLTFDALIDDIKHRSSYKPVYELLREIDDSHPLWEYVKDKGGDIAVAGILEHWPVIWATLKAILTVGGAIQL